MFKLHHDIIGKKAGNFRPSMTEREVLLEKIRKEMLRRKIVRIFSPHCAMTTKVTRLGQRQELYQDPAWFLRTKSGFDGGMVDKPNIGLAIFNADCPIVIIFDKKHGHLVMLHAGLHCLLPKDDSISSIISPENFKLLGFDLSNSEAFIGYGIGACCYGINAHLKDMDTSKYDPFLSKAIRGPRKEQQSINLYQLAAYQLRQSGMNGLITIDHLCTACTDRNENFDGKFHSNVYEGPSAGRNLVMAWFN